MKNRPDLLQSIVAAGTAALFTKEDSYGESAPFILVVRICKIVCGIDLEREELFVWEAAQHRAEARDPQGKISTQSKS